MSRVEQDILNPIPPDISNLTRGLSEIGARTHWSYRTYGEAHAVSDDAGSKIPKHATNIQSIPEGKVLFESTKSNAAHTHGRPQGSFGGVPFEWKPKAS